MVGSGGDPEHIFFISPFVVQLVGIAARSFCFFYAVGETLAASEDIAVLFTFANRSECSRAASQRVNVDQFDILGWF